jgi:hypothetical protein
VVENYFERVAYAAELAPIAADIVEDRLLDLMMRCLAEVNVDESELRPLLIKCPRVDRLPEFLRRPKRAGMFWTWSPLLDEKAAVALLIIAINSRRRLLPQMGG